MSGIIVGKYKGNYLIAGGQDFVLLAAPTGANKGVAVVLPNLLNFPDSVVVFDLKLENHKLTSKFRQQHDQQVYLFAPFSEERRTHRWNMLDTISRDPVFRVGDVLAIGQVFYPSDCDPREKFWNDNARNLFLAFVLYLMESPEMPCTLGEVFRQDVVALVDQFFAQLDWVDEDEDGSGVDPKEGNQVAGSIALAKAPLAATESTLQTASDAQDRTHNQAHAADGQSPANGSPVKRRAGHIDLSSLDQQNN